MFYLKTDLEKIQELRKKYDPQFSVILPHITLVFPFADIPEEKIVEHLSEITKSIHSFSIHLSGYMKSFDDYLFLLVQEGKEEIQRVHDQLYSGILLSELRSEIPFVLHITLGEFTNNKELSE